MAWPMNELRMPVDASVQRILFGKSANWRYHGQGGREVSRDSIVEFVICIFYLRHKHGLPVSQGGS
jgi:hypothetical protein